MTTTSDSTHQDFPAVDRIAEELRIDLVRAARAHSARPRLISRRGMIGLAIAVVLIGAPAGLAGAGVFSAEPAAITFECADARAELEPLDDVVAGAPTVGPSAPGAILEESSRIPENPCVDKAHLPALPAGDVR